MQLHYFAVKQPNNEATYTSVFFDDVELRGCEIADKAVTRFTGLLVRAKLNNIRKLRLATKKR